MIEEAREGGRRAERRRTTMGGRIGIMGWEGTSGRFPQEGSVLTRVE
jgi:hypothetical protein